MTKVMKAFELEDLLRSTKASGQRYYEFLRVPAMSIGIYAPTVKSGDPQKPHKQDEVYYVLSGVASIEVEGEKQPVNAGSVVYVPALAKHRFVDITEDLEILVFFAPAEGD